MLRRISLVAAAMVVGMALPTGAAAGGMSWFEFDQAYYVPGERAVGETGFSFSREDRQLLQRTWRAYLVPRHGWIEPPRIPHDAVPVGTVTFGALARVSFIVPDLQPGGYSVAICDQPCRNAYLGDLGGGWIRVVGSEEEARLRKTIDGLRDRLGRVQRNMERSVVRYRDRLADLQAQIDALTGESERQQGVLDSALAALARKPAAETSWFDRAGWLVAVLALAALVLVSGRKRRRPVPAVTESSNGHLAPATVDLGWTIEAAEEAEDHTPVGVR